jgi:hypothetical protein
MNTFRQLVASERPLVLPGAHDAISARLIQRAGWFAWKARHPERCARFSSTASARLSR